MGCKSFTLFSILGIILVWSVIPRNAVISSSRSTEKCYEGRFTREIKNFDLIVPHRANSDGTFLSYSLPHFYDRTVRREKREAQNEEPKVHYVLTIDGVPHHIELWPHHGVISPNLVVERRSPNISEVVAKLVPDRQCHYVGRVRGHRGSRAALSVCDGMAGYVRVRRDMYYIEPEKTSKPEEDGQHMHLVYRATDHNVHSSYPTPGSSNCGAQNDWEKDWRDRLHWEVQNDPDFFNHSVNKRSENKHRYIELCFIADKKFITFHKDIDTENYLLTIANIVASFYHDNTLGIAIDVILTRIIYLEKEEEEIDLEISSDAQKTFDSFCKWAEKLKPRIENHPQHFDIAILVTRYDICTDPLKTCGITGLTHTAQACRKNRGCCISEDIGLLLGNSITHQLGHSLGCPHDIPWENGCNPQLEDESFTVMGPFAMMNTHSWSNCSRKHMSEFFNCGLGDCLLNKPVESIFKMPDMPPGALYDAKYQCEERFGKCAKVCPITGDRMCRKLFCQVDGKRCLSTGNAPADGTKCGENMWCFDTKCVTAGERPEAINGQWSKWGSWSECSRTCGGGIQFQLRECDNPKPQHRGRYCVGQRKRYRVCQVKPCDSGNPTFREVQCSKFNGKILGRKWKPFFSGSWGANPCKLLCVNENNIRIKGQIVEDGTRCRPGTKDTCVSGVCRKVGCDWILDSDAIEDECGICKGNGTGCMLVEGNYTMEMDEGYQNITNIPEGSTNINVLEIMPSRNFIAVTDSNGTYLLNGNKKQQADGVVSFGEDVIGVYTHVEPRKEELIIKGPTKYELILQLFFVVSINPGFQYSYFERSYNESYLPRYDWDFIEWGTCSAKCAGGTQISIPYCVEDKHGHVSDAFCPNESKPEPLSRSCNMHECKHRWKCGPWGPCENEEQKRSVYCVRENSNPSGEDIMSDCSNCPDTRPDESKPCSEEKQKENTYSEEQHEGQYSEKRNDPKLGAYAPDFSTK